VACGSSRLQGLGAPLPLRQVKSAHAYRADSSTVGGVFAPERTKNAIVSEWVEAKEAKFGQVVVGGDPAPSRVSNVRFPGTVFDLLAAAAAAARRFHQTDKRMTPEQLAAQIVSGIVMRGSIDRVLTGMIRWLDGQKRNP